MTCVLLSSLCSKVGLIKHYIKVCQSILDFTSNDGRGLRGSQVKTLRKHHIAVNWSERSQTAAEFMIHFIFPLVIEDLNVL